MGNSQVLLSELKAVLSLGLDSGDRDADKSKTGGNRLRLFGKVSFSAELDGEFMKVNQNNSLNLILARIRGDKAKVNFPEEMIPCVSKKCHTPKTS
ncbi:hypothetical protein DY000_02023997 [Brassica cretica]|uniref:Uncharacterized protein n=1 Tax=Brassica cretica TaxID=69181 RepID=A0ABQ7EAQ1_BRACR|nr:hypothetical protein DY000_02023997 [Brassica cretica]